MKKIFLSLAVLLAIVKFSYSQNTSPFWSLAGNSNATTTSSLGTTNSVDLRLVTNNVEKMRINVLGAVGIGTTTINNSAKLDINSTTRGLLIPRMTLAQRNLITTPATGLLVFQTDNVPGFYFYTGSAWSPLKGANTNLSNLTAPIAINQVLTPNANNTLDIGSFSLGWRNIFAARSYYLAGSKVVDITGTSNTFLGNTGSILNTGIFNTFVGNATGAANTSGGGNVALGSSALTHSQTGNENLSVGRSSLYSNISGSYNVAVGNFALVGNVNNTQNTGVGYFALGNTTASDGNTALGYQAGNNFNNGYYNCFLGSETGTNAANYYNVITIGHGTIATAPSQVIIGNTATSSYRIYGSWSNISDGRYKKNIKENVPGLDFINKLKAVTYNLDAKALDNFLHKNRVSKNEPGNEKAVMDKALSDKEKHIQTGFIAQDVEKAAKEIGYDFSGVDVAQNENDVYGLKYAEFVVPLVKAVQELSAKNNEKDQRIASLEARLDKLETLLKSTASSTILSNASLNQNLPNPFGTSTTISYILPLHYKKAQVEITDAAGKLLKTININNGSGRGILNVDGSVLSAGTYHYSLYIDNSLISTKTMIKGNN